MAQTRPRRQPGAAKVTHIHLHFHDADFDESDHPRNESGQFTSGGGGQFVPHRGVEIEEGDKTYHVDHMSRKVTGFRVAPTKRRRQETQRDYEKRREQNRTQAMRFAVTGHKADELLKKADEQVKAGTARNPKGY